jgi:hypothetical protein
VYPSLGEVLMQTMDWIAKHRSTHTSASDMWDFIRTIIPESDTMGTYNEVRKIVKTHRLETMEVVHVCVNTCVAFIDALSPELQGSEFQNSTATSCPVCEEDRYLANGETPRRVTYVLPVKFWLQDLFAKADLVPFLYNDLPPASFPSGHVRRSEGWRQKVTENPSINADRRNQALSVSADGMPYFKDMNSTNGWIVSVIAEALGEGNLGHHVGYVHLAALAPSEYLTQAGRDVLKTKK